MKGHYFKALIVMVGLAATTLTSCKKSSTAADDSISTKDANSISNGMSSTSDDAASAAGQVSSYKSLMGLNNSGGNLLVGATITDTSSTGIVITYDGSTACNGIVRSGTVTITNTGGIPWHEAGAQLTVTYDNVTFYDQITQYTYKLNGSHTITNVTGGLAWKVAAGLAPNTTVTHQIKSSNMSITFPNGVTQTNWTVNRIRSWTSTGTLITVTLSGSSATGNVTETGTNRFGDQFINTISSPIMGNSGCLWRPYTGTWTHQVSTRTATVQFGSNLSGQIVGSATTCPASLDYGYYITYTNGSTTLYKFVPYW
jgi:hypothetical protein